MKSKLLLLCLSMEAVFAWGQLPYQNANLSASERAADLCGRLTLEEKAKLMVNSSEAIPRLGIPEFSWWNEALHGVARNGKATVFPCCIGMASSFDDALLYKVYSAVSDEGRAKHTAAEKRGKRYAGVSYWTPNINIFRDPRWGRGQETYGEDPYQTGRMASMVVKGLQGDDGHKYRKAFACAKHFAVHSGPESTRHHLNLDNISPRDLWETYLPAFKTLVKEAGVKEVMCAYQRLDGEPCCGNNRLLTQILRNEWGFDGIVVSDCGAIRDFYQKGHHEVSADAPSAAGKAVLSGTDVNCGSVYLKLPEAVEKGYIKESDIDVSVKRLLQGRFELGDFDSDELNDWTKIPESVVCSKEHKELALQMAREQMVLLHNKNHALPLERSEKVLLMGPNAADSLVLWSIYYGQPTHSVTIKEGIESKIGVIPYYKACELTDYNDSPTKNIRKVLEYGTDDYIPEANTSKEIYSVESALYAAEDYETVIFVGGISPIIEREEARVDLPGFKGGDRTSIELPMVQREILAALHWAGKKVIFVNCSGSAVALTPELKSCDAILQAWYPGEQGGYAVADVLYGDYNPSGKLPVTFYKDDSVLKDFEDYSLKGYTYRYIKQKPLFPYGFGLSYTTFEIGKAELTEKAGERVMIVPVTNTGGREGTEVVQLYMRCLDDKEGPNLTLRGYVRVTLKAGETRNVEIPVPESTFERFDSGTNTMRVVPGRYELLYGTSSAKSDLKSIKVKL
ncbi:MAG: glycoside hydrolase family 3 N-terminal domain-containing protein [Prevotellaceae bacterium]|nr:glycoside hydrolase family 3 N-terminal domain-containing protein [Prevotellaceae bacterium]